MAEYIELEELINNRPEGRNPKQICKEEYNKGWNDCRSAFYALIADSHPADVAPVRHGRWDSIPNTYICVAEKDGSYHGNATSCSACNEINPNAYKTNYCPNCGAKMDGDGNG